jgi:hypothetical protein
MASGFAITFSKKAHISKTFQKRRAFLEASGHD